MINEMIRTKSLPSCLQLIYLFASQLQYLLFPVNPFCGKKRLLFLWWTVLYLTTQLYYLSLCAQPVVDRMKVWESWSHQSLGSKPHHFEIQ